MNVKKKKNKRMYGACILFLTAMLTLITVVLAASGQVERSSSYTLIIKKVFDENTPTDVAAAAENQVYTFRVEAQVKSGGGYESEERIVTIKGQGETEVEFSNAFKVSIIEQTDGGGFDISPGNKALTAGSFVGRSVFGSVGTPGNSADKSAGTPSNSAEGSISTPSNFASARAAEGSVGTPVHWDVVKTECLSEMHAGAAQATVNINKDGGRIEVTRPQGAPTASFELAGKPLHEENESKFEGEFPKRFNAAAGETKEFTNLPQGEYTITELRAPDGFSVLVGPRDFNVGAGESGKVYINGSDSKISIKAPEPENDVVLTHHYRISKGGRKYREIDVLSGETGTVEHLDEGEYTIEVFETYGGFKGYTVAYPSTTCKATGIISTHVTESDGRSYKRYSVKDENQKVADQVEFYRYGPLYDASGNMIKDNVTYQVNWGIHDGKGVVRNNTSKSARPGNYYYTIKDDYLKRLVPTNGYLYFTTTGVSNSAVNSIELRWREYRETEMTREILKPLSDGYRVTVNGLTENYITITKPEDEHARGGDVKYYYTVKNSNGDLIGDYTVTDESGNAVNVPKGEIFQGNATTVTLRAGQTVKIGGLKQGAIYRIYESVEEAPAKGFSVKLEDTKRTVTEAERGIEIQTLGERRVEISKPGNSKGDGERDYTYNIYEGNKSEVLRTVMLKSGETKTVAEATGSMLPAGEYRIVPADDHVAGFDVKFTDSSTLTSDYIRNATVTFTNTFGKVEESYHVIHEYYLKNDDGSYSFEGASPVYTKNCDHNHSEGDGHYATEDDWLTVYCGNTYDHLSDAYGKVVSWPKGEKAVEVELADDDVRYENSPYLTEGTGSNGMGTDKDPGTRDYAYVPLKNLTFATATPHSHKDGVHEGGAQIIILRYYREDTPPEGKYNVIHVYYKRTNEGDKWEGRSDLEVRNVGRLNKENSWTTYDASDVTKVPKFSPRDGEEYMYQYDGAAYGRIAKSDGDNFTGEGVVEEGMEYRKDDTMTSVKATVEGDQIIILRYYRVGGYSVVHEYYCREKAGNTEDSGEIGGDTGESGETGENPDEDGGEDGDSGNIGSGFQGTLTDSDGYIYKYVGKSDIFDYPARLGEWHEAKEVERKENYDTYTYTYKDAVYGYLGENSEEYWLAPYKTGVTSNEEHDEVIILRYYREETSEKPPKVSYKVVHEYYKEDENGTRSFVGRSDIREVIDASVNVEYRKEHVQEEPVFGGVRYTWFDCGYGTVSGEDYSQIAEKDHVRATESGGEIIILRYVWKEKPKDPSEDPPKVSYKVVHEYYKEDENGTRSLVGRSDIREITDADPQEHYIEKHVEREPVFGGVSYTWFDFGYGTVSGEDYSQIAEKQYVLATKSGEEIIILRYVLREKPKDPSKVSYKVVHEYYKEDENGTRNLVGRSDIREVTDAIANVPYEKKDVQEEPVFGGVSYTWFDCGYGTVSGEDYSQIAEKDHVLATESGEEIIILRYVLRETPKDPEDPPKVSYKVVHEYYEEDENSRRTLVGRSDIREVTDAIANVRYEKKDVQEEPIYREIRYDYFEVGYGTVSGESYSQIAEKQYVLATESGEEIIILRYVRRQDPETPSETPEESSETPETPPRRPSSGGGSNPSPRTPETTSGTPETTPGTPGTSPETPDYPTELPDPNAPDSPERITIIENGVPTTYVKRWDPDKEEWIYIQENDTPLGDLSLPKTGDSGRIALWVILAVGSLCGLAIISTSPQKRRNK